MEYFGEDPFDCVWMKTTLKDVLVVRFQVIVPEWASSQYLLSPQLLHNCTRISNMCTLFPHSLLLPGNPGSDNKVCLFYN